MYFLKKYKDRMMVTAVAIILIVIIGITSVDRLSFAEPEKVMSKPEKVMGNLLTPISKFTFNMGKKVSNFWGTIKNLSKILQENETLNVEIAELKERNRDLENIIGKSDYLKNEAELLLNTEHNLISGQVISKEPGNWYYNFNIDKGSNHGIKKGATVIQGIETEKGVVKEGIVGRVSDVGDNWAKVISIVDELNRVSFKIIRTQDGGIVSGSIDGTDRTLSGYLFDSKADVIVGDKLYTSGLGKTFAKDIYIGEVEEVIELEEELMKKIVVKPAINFKKLYRVFVILD